MDNQIEQFIMVSRSEFKDHLKRYIELVEGGQVVYITVNGKIRAKLEKCEPAGIVE